MCNLQEYNIEYLRALLKNDTSTIVKHELVAMQEGYGPRGIRKMVRSWYS